VRKQPVLGFVPLRGARREVTHRDRQARLGGQGREFGLPRPGAVAGGSPGVCGDQQPGGVRVVIVTARLPPTADRGDGERGVVVIDSDIDPAGIGALRS
jgi:hypothetical protein